MLLEGALLLSGISLAVLLVVSLTGIALFTTRASLLNIVSKEAAQIACFVKLFSIILSKKYPVPFLLVRGILFVILS